MSDIGVGARTRKTKGVGYGVLLCDADECCLGRVPATACRGPRSLSDPDGALCACTASVPTAYPGRQGDFRGDGGTTRDEPTPSQIRDTKQLGVANSFVTVW